MFLSFATPILTFILSVGLFFIILWLIFGAIIGALAGSITKSKMGFLGNAFIGILGSFVGEIIAGLLGFHEANFLISFLFSIIGAVVLLLIGQSIFGRE